MKLFYGRVSSKEQDLSRQIDWAKEKGVEESKFFLDKKTGKNFNREGYKELIKFIDRNPNEKMELFIMEVDRLGRDKTMTMKAIRTLRDKKVVLRLGNIPQTMTEMDDIMSEMVQNIMIEIYTTMAQQEIENKAQRQTSAYKVLGKNKDGKQIGKNGKVVGRKKKVVDTKQLDIIKSWANGEIKLAECKRLTGIASATLYRLKKEYFNK